MTERGADRSAEREELQAAVAARRELGPVYEDAALESFLDRLDRSIAARVDARVQERSGPTSPVAARAPAPSGPPLQFVLGPVSLGAGIPITAISASVAGSGGLLIAGAGIVGVNVAHAISRRQA